MFLRSPAFRLVAVLSLFTLPLAALVSVMTRGAGEGIEIAWMFQGAGAALFFLLFLRSRYLPGWLARLGIVGTAVLVPISAVMFVLPHFIGPLKLLGLPGLVAEAATAIWLLVKGLGPRDSSTSLAPRSHA
jgi:hypothetical protein